MSDSEDNAANNLGNDEIENGHISSSEVSVSPNLRSSGSEEEDEPEAQNGDVDGNFNIDLPTTHKYLGKLNNISSYTLFDDNEIVSMMAIHTNTLVFPGFTLPLVMNNHYESNVMQHYMETRKVFVLLCTDEFFDGVFDYGVTMEIYETDMKNHNLCLKARGRQRCQIVPNSEVKHLAGRLQKVTVRILPEYKIESPLCNTQLYTLKSKRRFISNDYDVLKECRKYRKYHLAQFPFASWVYERYELCYYVKYILEGLSKIYLKEFIPSDPVTLSYWFIQNYLLQHQERLFLMKQNTVLERLKLEMKCLKVDRRIQCNMCRIDIADQSDVFVMSKDGVQSNYCNPGGYVFETLTFSEAKNYQLIGNPSKQFSWFPGYSWTIIQCKDCRQHLGWKFTSDVLYPHYFFGLAKNGFEVTAEIPALNSNTTLTLDFYSLFAD